jgi:hypothetical protein
VNGDGYSDVLVAATLYDNGETNEGAVFIYHGSVSGINTTAATRLESNQASAYFGYSVASAGDINGDGYSDIITGAMFFSNGQVEEGAVFVYRGSASGINTTPVALLEGNQAMSGFGYSVASAGDVNGDGYSDVIVGACYYNNGQTYEGASFIYHGSASGLNTTVAIMLESNQSFAEFGNSVSSAGDVNGDGYSDVIVGAYNYDNGQSNEGAVFVYHGSASGISPTYAVILESDQNLASFGCSVASAGDINGDGYSDMIVGANAYENGELLEGAAFIYQGTAGGISTSPITILERNQARAELGIAVASAGDVNGDGYSDVIVGAYSYDNGQTDEGAAFIYQGSAEGLRSTANTQIESNQAAAEFAYSVASAGDINGDGYSDVIVGAYMFDNNHYDDGIVFIFHGSSSGISTTMSAQLEPDITYSYFGYSVASAGDVNGDGYSDIIVGAPAYENGESGEGVVFIYHGSATGLHTTAVTRIQSNQAYAQLGSSVACAGDVNGDGFSDVIVGAYKYDDGQVDEGAAFIYLGSSAGISTIVATQLEGNQPSTYFGNSVACAGDINGDGYSDILVGAYYYSNGQSWEGVVFVYQGSINGIGATPTTILECNQTSAHFGTSVASAGDVNGDGFADVIIGAYLYDNGETNEGAAFVFHGSSGGISTTPAVLVESNQVSAFYGYCVSSAGDVNGDGYSDVIVGAYHFDNGQTDEGASFVYHGSASGLNTTVATLLESNQASSDFGFSVASAGDVNGDGFSDIIVGAKYYDNGQTDEGAFFSLFRKWW